VKEPTTRWKVQIMKRNVLWIDDDPAQRDFGKKVLAELNGVTARIVSSSEEARRVLDEIEVHAVVTDILRRDSMRNPSADDGYAFFKSYIRPKLPRIPVIFHTKNLPGSFERDEHSHLLSKWDEPGKKAIELEQLISDRICLYEAFIDYSIWRRIQDRLVEVNTKLLEQLHTFDDIWSLSTSQFEELVAELLQKLGYHVRWLPGGKDGGIDIVAGADDHTYLIDVKRWKAKNPVSVEVVRRIYGVAEAVSKNQPGIFHGGIVTSSYFTSEAKVWRDQCQPRPLLLDGEWLRKELEKYSPWPKGH
jgi:CheY-like chemotaxis protein